MCHLCASRPAAALAHFVRNRMETPTVAAPVRPPPSTDEGLHDLPPHYAHVDVPPVLVAPDGRPGTCTSPAKPADLSLVQRPLSLANDFPSVSCENLEARNRSSRSAARAPSLRRSRPRSQSLCPMLLYVAWSPFGHRASVWLPDATAATTGHLRFVHPRHIEGLASVR